MLILGLTGGISTGKSAASRWFSGKGVPVIGCDEIVHELLSRGGGAYSKVVKLFSPLVPGLVISGEIDRKRLGRFVFENSEYRKHLEKIVHPMVISKVIGKLLYHYLSVKSMVVVEIPLLYELGLERCVSRVLVVYCDPNVQVSRLIARDKLEFDEAMLRISTQIPIGEKKRRTDLVVDNSGSWDATETQLEFRYAQILPSRYSTLGWWCLSVVGILLVAPLYHARHLL